MTTIRSARALAAALLTAVGMPEKRAEVTARCVVQADVWGIASHGLLRLPYYLRRIQLGGYPADAELEAVTDTGPMLALRGNGGLGHWQLWDTANELTERAAQYGIAAASVADSGHCGALGLYTIPGIRAGQLTLVFSTGPAVMAAWGGAQPLLSTSPLAAGIPSSPTPCIVDMASSAVARGKIAAAAASGEPLPDGWALDDVGSPTTDPSAALHGLLSPLGGAKGFALALLVEAIAGGLAGPNLAADVPDMFAESDAALPQRIGHVLIVLDPTRFGGPEALDRLRRLAESVGTTGGRLPGAGRVFPEEVDPEASLELTEGTRTALRNWAQRLDVKHGTEDAPCAAGNLE